MTSPRSSVCPPPHPASAAAEARGPSCLPLRVPERPVALSLAPGRRPEGALAPAFGFSVLNAVFCPHLEGTGAGGPGKGGRPSGSPGLSSPPGGFKVHLLRDRSLCTKRRLCGERPGDSLLAGGSGFHWVEDPPRALPPAGRPPDAAECDSPERAPLPAGEPGCPCRPPRRGGGGAQKSGLVRQAWLRAD